MEREYMGTGKAKVWTYLILGVVLIVAIVVANFALANPTLAREGVDAFMGMPPWAFPIIGAMLVPDYKACCVNFRTRATHSRAGHRAA